MRIYYAHCLALYDTPQETRDLALIREIFGQRTMLVNPNCAGVRRQVKKAKADGHDVMTKVFRSHIERCDMVIFRGTPFMGIPAGVALELEWATELAKPILELPTAMAFRHMGLQTTREYLLEVGYR